jgi:hypothetical protein
MTVTGLSSAPTSSDLGCYTDVHVNYYAVPPTPMTWYIDYHVSGGCTNPPGIPFQQALNITSPDTTCDVGLDINGADHDITSGGVEHYTASAMPAGYYVVSINNYDCDPTKISNMASIIIGDYLFGPYNCTYTASDTDGPTPGAWCRLADIRMNVDGSANVLAPDATINPWH